MQAITYKDHTKFKSVLRIGDIRDLKVYCVCQDRCNNGWMREKIDEAARKIMIPLISGANLRITPEQQARIAAWAALKLMVSEYDDGANVTVNYKHKKTMMNSHIAPKHWGIWIGNFKRSTWISHWVSHPIEIVRKDASPNRPRPYFNGRVLTQVIGQLFIHTMNIPVPSFIESWRFSPPDGGTLVRIWPPTTTSVLWPLKPMTDRDANYAAWAIRLFLERQKLRLTSASAGLS